MTPHKCPVCDGTGKVSRPPWIPGDQATFDSASLGPWPCQSCGGTGIILMGIDKATAPDKTAIHCPCGTALVVEEFPVTCPNCGTRYDYTADGSRLHMVTVHDYPDAVDVVKEEE